MRTAIGKTHDWEIVIETDWAFIGLIKATDHFEGKYHIAYWPKNENERQIYLGTFSYRSGLLFCVRCQLGNIKHSSIK